MKRLTFILFILSLSLAACASPATLTPAPEATSAPESGVSLGMPIQPVGSESAPAVTEMVVEPQGKLAVPSFESQTYINESVGFAMEYPAGWTVNEQVIGSRGTQVQFLSVPEIAELATVPAGATRVTLMIYQWDPKNDLAAYLENRKGAWEASGFTILDEEPVTLDLGLEAVRITLRSTDGVTVLYQIAALNGQYLSISGEGDLSLAEEMMRYLRPVGAQ